MYTTSFPRMVINSRNNELKTPPRRIMEEVQEAHRHLIRGRVLNVGGGSRPYRELSPEMVNVDFSTHPQVNLRVDFVRDGLPFKDGSFDTVLCMNVLEHVRDPARVLAEIRRVLRPGGFLLFGVPFLYPYHPDPDDYWRFTASGIRELLRDFREVRVIPLGGRFSTLLLFLHQLGGIPRPIVRWLYRPLRFMDRFDRHPAHWTTGFFATGRNVGP